MAVMKWWWRLDEKRGWPWGLWSYAPIGLLCFLIRLGILIQFFLLKLILPQSKFKGRALGIMGGILGVTITTEGEVSDTARIFVSNQVTAIDHFVIHMITHALQYREATQLPSYLEALFGIRTGNGRREETEALIFFPEGESTNGSSGLLTFGDLPPQVENPERLVQPIALSVSRTFLNVNTLESGLGSEFFLTLFSFNTHYRLKFLPVREWESVETQRVIANSLGVQPTKYSLSDKNEYLKKVNFRPMSMATKARLVQQQLHPIQMSPESVISALERTGSIEEAVKELRKTIAQPSFPKNASQRMSTFQERKRLMVEAAREKYAIKHGIQLPS